MNNKKTQLSVNQLKSLNIEKNTPAIFNKKSKNIVSQPLTHIRSDTGKTRHFTPAAQE